MKRFNALCKTQPLYKLSHYFSQFMSIYKYKAHIKIANYIFYLSIVKNEPLGVEILQKWCWDTSTSSQVWCCPYILNLIGKKKIWLALIFWCFIKLNDWALQRKRNRILQPIMLKVMALTSEQEIAATIGMWLILAIWNSY